MMGVYEPDKSIPVNTFSYKTDRKTTAEALGLIVKKNLESIHKNIAVDGLAFSSVVTEVNIHYHEMAKSFFNAEALEISNKINLNIKIMYDNPEELGPDRIANAEAALGEYSNDCIIIDLGTANTFCVLHKNGTFDGGLIGPGIGITIDALAEKTSKLSRIDFEKPSKFIATNTRDALKSGFFYGYLLMIKGIIAEIKKIYKKEFMTILTGGLSKIISEHLNEKHILDPLLTMKGVKILYDFNKKR
jgi:type III pantothenate kinase